MTDTIDTGAGTTMNIDNTNGLRFREKQTGFSLIKIICVASVCATMLLLVAGAGFIYKIFTSVTGEHEEAALAQVGESIIDFAKTRREGIVIPVALETMLERMSVQSVQLSDNDTTVTVQLTVPDVQRLRTVGSLRTYTVYEPGDALYITAQTQAEEAKSYLSSFSASYAEAARTSLMREITATIPIKFSATGYELNWEECTLLHIIEEYAYEFSRELNARLAESDITRALNDYLYPDDVLEAMHYYIIPGSVRLETDSWGNVYISAAHVESGEAFEVIRQELLDKYKADFHTQEITAGKLQADLSAMILYRAIDASDVGIFDKQILDISNIPSDSMRINGLFTAQLQEYLNEFEAVVTSLKSETDLLTIYQPEPEPESSVLKGVSTGVSLTIENTAGFGAYYVVFTSVPGQFDVDISLGVYIRDSEVFSVRLPAGVYNVKYASGSGDSWFGIEQLFGSSGRYSISASTIELESGSYVLTLNTESDLGDAVDELVVAKDEW